MMTNVTGFYTLLRRETYRFVRLFRQTIVPPVVNSLLYILIFGLSMGSRIKEIHGFAYVLFIIPGLAQNGIITNAYANSSTSLYMARLERSIENMLIAPLSYLQIVLACILGAVMRGMTIGFATMAVAVFFYDFPLPHPFLLIASWFLSCVLFGSLGLISGIVAESWDHLSLVTTFVLTPLTYLGGTFFSVDMLPPFWQKVSYLNPIFYCIDSTRYAILGVSDVPEVYSFSIIAAMAVASVLAATLMVKKGHRLIH